MALGQISLITIFYIILILYFVLPGSPTETTKIPSTTCDFDLEDIESLLQYMPLLCIEIYNNRSSSNDGGRYNSYLEESKAFGKFYKKLDDYELLSEQPNQHELLVYPFEAQLRRDIYQEPSSVDCPTNETVIEFLDCIKTKHIQKEQLVPPVALK